MVTGMESTTHLGAAPHSHQVVLDDGLEFINTLEHERTGDVEHLASLPAALDWLHAHELLHDDSLQRLLERHASDPPAAQRSMAKIRRVRTAMRGLVDATVERRPPQRRQLAEVNRALRTPFTYVLVPAPDGVSMGHRHDGDPLDGALARLAETVAREVSQGHPERLRVCANTECRWVFHDTSRSGRRRWCTMATCGNRAKVARHRQRQRDADAPAPVPRRQTDAPGMSAKAAGER
jgi:predicted RNA-binding Zn ribbon-like protein